MTTLLDRDRAWEAIDAQRLRVAAMLDQLTDQEWHHPSLCQGWTVRDVAAHLTLQQVTWGEALKLMVKYRGNTNRGIHLDQQRSFAAVCWAHHQVGRSDRRSSHRSC
jgi:uncharacterized protein (TIGR03083 family)